MRRTALGAAVLAVAAVAAGWTAATPVLNLTLSGTANGKPLNGKVTFARVMCVPLTGKGLEVQWSGSVKTGSGNRYTNVSGDLSFQKTGKSTFGVHGNAVASLVVGADYSNRLGSGLPGGGGTATVGSTRKSGSLSVTLVYRKSKVHEQGTFSC